MFLCLGQKMKKVFHVIMKIILGILLGVVCASLAVCLMFVIGKSIRSPKKVIDQEKETARYTELATNPNENETIKSTELATEQNETDFVVEPIVILNSSENNQTESMTEIIQEIIIQTEEEENIVIIDDGTNYNEGEEIIELFTEKGTFFFE